jgi:mono/diheme cytochrome c family protein
MIVSKGRAAVGILSMAASLALMAAAPAPQPSPAPQTVPQTAAQTAPTEADAKAILESACSTCHGVDFITERRKSREDWAFTVNQMISRGAELSPEETALVVDYLARAYPKDTPPPEAKPQG